MIAAALMLALVQHGGHGAPAAACSPEHAAMGHCKLPKAAPRAVPKPVKAKPAKVQAVPRRKPGASSQRLDAGPRPAPGRDNGGSPAPASPAAKIELAPQPAATGCSPEHAAMGHCQLPAAPAPTAASGASGTDLPAGNGPAPAAPTATYADRIYGGAMTSSRAQMYREHGGGTFSQVMIDLAEVRFRNGRDGFHWDGEGWFGGDRDRLVIRSEGEGVLGRGVEDAEVQVLYSRAIGPYFNLQAGLRHDINPNPSRTYFAAGVEGLAPYWFEVEATAFLSDQGDLSVRLSGYYDQRITQRLIVQPRAEVNLAASGDPSRGVGSGISDFDLGLRLRYELAREFAPYVGVAWDRKLGDTARYARAAGDDASSVSMVAGVRVWF